MRIRPLDIGPLHFVGIGGIGMSGIAEILCNMGYTVQGSDIAENTNIKRLRDRGARVALGHRAENVEGADVVVVSSAIAADNPELIAARERRIPVVRRADMLGELMRLRRSVAVAGTHGKTTTTAIVAGVFDAAGLDPTVINGGIINAYDTNARLGQGEWMVVEADESDGSFLRLPATVGIVTNIDPEHMEHYGSFDAVREAYRSFVERLPFYGFAALCTDHPEVQALLASVTDRRIVTYGLNAQADVRATDLKLDAAGARFDVRIAIALARRGCWRAFVCPCKASITSPMRSPPSPSPPSSALPTTPYARPLPGSAASSGGSRSPARSTESPSSTTTPIIRWRSVRCWPPPVPPPKAR